MGRQVRRSAPRGIDPGTEISRLIWLHEHGGCREVVSRTWSWYGETTTRWVRPDGTTCTNHRPLGQPVGQPGSTSTEPKSKAACYNPTSARERKARRAKQQAAPRKQGAKSPAKAGK